MALTKGCDVSKYQEVSDWAPLVDQRNWEFLIARASIGTTLDPRFDNHIAKAKRLGLVTGAYHFNWDTDYSGTASPREQARFFVKAVRAVGGVDLMFLDVEGKMAFEAAEAKAFIDEVQKAGHRIGLYMSASAYKWNYGQDYDWIARWVADPPKGDPSGDWELWQYTSHGKSTDKTRLDLDYFNGSLAELKSLIGRRDTMGLRINLALTRDAKPYDAIARARVKADGNRARYSVETGEKASIGNGLDLGVVQLGTWDEGKTPWTPIVALNYGNPGELWVVRQRAVDLLPVDQPPTGCTAEELKAARDEGYRAALTDGVGNPA